MGGNYLLNVGPKATGEIPAESVDRLKAMGNWMKVNSESIYGTYNSPFKKSAIKWGRCTAKDDRLYLHVFDWPEDGKLIVPTIKNEIAKAYLLANRGKLSTTKHHDGIVIEVPEKALDDVATVIVLVVVYPLLLRTVGKVNPIRFYRNVSPAMLVAASTTSSSATLPVSMGVAEKDLGVSEKVYGFTLPLGATINMDGMAVAVGVLAVFASNLHNEPITLARIVQFVFLGLVLSIGTAGIKGAGIVISTVLLQTLGLPLTIVPILASIWPVIDIGHTACNVSGDLCGTTIVASRLKMLDAAVFKSSQ